MKNRIYFNILIFSIITLLFILLAYILPIRFETSDDITMANIVNGSWYGSPSSNMIFQSNIYGFLLSIVYKKFPNVEWYTLIMCMIHILAMTIIVLETLKFIKKKSTLILAFSFYFVFWMYLIAKLQFTSTSALLSFAATLLLLHKKFCIGGILFFCSAMMRFEAAMMIGLFMSPVYLYFYKEDLFLNFVRLFIILFVIVGVKYYDSTLNVDIEYSVHNKYRSKIQDNPNAWRAFNHLPSNITKEDYSLLVNFFYDSSVFTTEVLKEISDQLAEIPLKYKLKAVYYEFILPNIMSMSIILSIMIICTIYWYRSDFLFYLLISSSICFFSFVYIGLDTYIKPYVYFSSVLPFFFNVFYMVGKEDNLISLTKHHVLHLLIVVYIFIIIFALFKNRIKYERSDYLEQVSLIETVDNKIIGLAFDECNVSPFDIRKPYTYRLDGFSFLTTTTTANTFKYILENEVLLLVTENSIIPKYVVNSLRNHNSLCVDTITINRSKKYKLVKLKEISND